MPGRHHWTQVARVVPERTGKGRHRFRARAIDRARRGAHGTGDAGLAASVGATLGTPLGATRRTILLSALLRLSPRGVLLARRAGSVCVPAAIGPPPTPRPGYCRHGS